MAETSMGPGRHELPLNVTGSSIFGRYPKISGEKTYNMFISDDWLVCMGGYQKVLELVPGGVGQGRGCFYSVRGNFALVVVNALVIVVSPSLGTQTIGTIDTFTGEVFIDENLNQQICIVDGSKAYIYNWGQPANLTVQTAGAFGTGALIPSTVEFHDTFFLFGNGLRTGVQTSWYVYGNDNSSLYQLKQVTALTFQTKPDYPLAIKRIPGQSSNVLVLGTSVSEVQTHIGGTDNYRRNSSVSIDYGCISVDTIAASDSYIAWLGKNESNAPVIMVFDGQKATPISTDGIDYLMGTINRPDLSTAFFFRQDGHLFYQITFYFTGTSSLGFIDADNITLFYDFNSNKFFNGSDQDLNYHPARQVFYLSNTENFTNFNWGLYFVSLNNGCLYKWDTDIQQIIEDISGEGDNPPPIDPNLVYDMQRIRICETIRTPKNTPFVVETVNITIDQGNNNSAPIFPCLQILITEDDYPTYPDTRIFSELIDLTNPDTQIVPEGHGTDDCQGIQDPGKVQLSISKDGTVTWSNYVDHEMYPLGYRKNIFKWDRLGLCNEFTPKFRFWASNRVIVKDGTLRILTAGRIK